MKAEMGILIMTIEIQISYRLFLCYSHYKKQSKITRFLSLSLHHLFKEEWSFSESIGYEEFLWEN